MLSCSPHSVNQAHSCTGLIFVENEFGETLNHHRQLEALEIPLQTRHLQLLSTSLAGCFFHTNSDSDSVIRCFGVGERY